MNINMYKASVVGKDFASFCKKGICGHIHSVFDRAINIAAEEQGNEITLLTLLRADADVMPSAVITSMQNGSWHSCGIKTYDKVILTSDCIYWKREVLLCGISTADVWQSVTGSDLIYLPRLTHSEIAIRCEKAEQYIIACRRVKSDLPTMPLTNFDVTRLLGLGDGLTPSGDDYLTGLLFAIHFAQMVYAKECGILPAIINDVRQNMVKLTNQISCHFLRYGTEGLWGKATEQFMLALFQPDDDNLYCTIDKKLSYGATSGMDEMFGIMFGLCETIKLFEEDGLCT